MVYEVVEMGSASNSGSVNRGTRRYQIPTENDHHERNPVRVKVSQAYRHGRETSRHLKIPSLSLFTTYRVTKKSGQKEELELA